MAFKSAITMMRLFIIGFTVLLYSCNGNRSSGNHNDVLSTQQADSMDKISDSTELSSPSILLPWEVDFERKTKKVNVAFTNIYLNTDSIIAALNYTYPDINLQKIKISHDTLFTEIKNSYPLTDGMGTSGAAIYLAVSVINLTTVPGVNAVKFNFQLGSHASPGVWSKNEFDDFTIIH